MLTGNNSYMHRTYIKFDTTEATKCVAHYYNRIIINKTSLEHLIMQFVGVPIHIIKMRTVLKGLVEFPWIFKSWNDAFAWFKSKHFQEQHSDLAVTSFLGDAISDFLIGKDQIKQIIIDKTKTYNLVSLEELIMTNKVKHTHHEPLFQDTTKEQQRANSDMVESILAEAKPAAQSDVQEWNGGRALALVKQHLSDNNSPLLNAEAREQLLEEVGPVNKEVVEEIMRDERLRDLRTDMTRYTSLTTDNLGKWVRAVLELSTTTSLQERRVVDHAIEVGYIGKPAIDFMTQFAKGFFTYSFRNLRHAEDNFKKLKSFAQKFVKANPPKQMTTAEYMADIEKQVRGSNVSLPVTPTDSKEETNMSANPTQSELYQSITKDLIDVKSVRALIRQLFIDSQNREPREAIIDRFMESIDVSAHEHWSFLIKFMLSDDYKPNLARLPFGEMIFAKLKAHLNNLESAGTFDFSGIPAVNDCAGIDTTRDPSLEVAKKEDVTVTKVEEDTTATKEAVGVEGVGIVEVESKSETSDETTTNTPDAGYKVAEMHESNQRIKDVAPMPRTEYQNRMWQMEQLRVLTNTLSDLFGSPLSFTKFPSELAGVITAITFGNDPIRVIGPGESIDINSLHNEVVKDVARLQLVAFYLLQAKEKFDNEEDDSYLRTILLYVDKLTATLKQKTNNGTLFHHDNSSIHLNIMPDFAKVEGDKIRASYLIASGLVSASRAQEIISKPYAPILTNLSLVPLEYQLQSSDSIKSDLVAIGIIQTMINLFTIEEKDVKKENEFTIDTSKVLAGEAASYLSDAPTPTAKPTQDQHLWYNQAVGLVTLNGILSGFNKHMDTIIPVVASALEIIDFNAEYDVSKADPVSNAFIVLQAYLAYVLDKENQDIDANVKSAMLFLIDQYQTLGLFKRITNLSEQYILPIIVYDFNDQLNTSKFVMTKIFKNILSAEHFDSLNKWAQENPHRSGTYTSPKPMLDDIVAAKGNNELAWALLQFIINVANQIKPSTTQEETNVDNNSPLHRHIRNTVNLVLRSNGIIDSHATIISTNIAKLAIDIALKAKLDVSEVNSAISLLIKSAAALLFVNSPSVPPLEVMNKIINIPSDFQSNEKVEKIIPVLSELFIVSRGELYACRSLMAFCEETLVGSKCLMDILRHVLKRRLINGPQSPFTQASFHNGPASGMGYFGSSQPMMQQVPNIQPQYEPQYRGNIYQPQPAINAQPYQPTPMFPGMTRAGDMPSTSVYPAMSPSIAQMGSLDNLPKTSEVGYGHQTDDHKTDRIRKTRLINLYRSLEKLTSQINSLSAERDKLLLAIKEMTLNNY